MAQDGHQGSFHAQRDPLPSQRRTNADLAVAKADQATGVDGAVYFDHRPIPGRQRAGARWACPVGGEPGQLGSSEPGRAGS